MRKILFSVANFGDSQLDYLVRLLRALGEWKSCEMRVVVDTTVDLSNHLPIHNENVRFEQRIFSESLGVRLPYKHRELFTENLGKYDWYFYSENDLLFHPNVVEFFEQKIALTDADDLIGFLRYEEFNGDRYLTDFDFKTPLTNGAPWRAGECIWYAPASMHSGCYLLSNTQLARVISSGGYVSVAHRQPYGVIEQAASDVYTQCGFRGKIIPLHYDEIFVHHMPNKYVNLANRIPRHRVSILRQLDDYVGSRDYYFDGTTPNLAKQVYRVLRLKSSELAKKFR